MNASISRRLAVMFAAASFMMISITSLATYALLKRELGRHQMTELTTRWDFNQFLVSRASDESKWPHVREKLDARTPEDGRARYWVLSDDPAFRYGTLLPGMERLAKGPDGFGELTDPGKRYPMKALVRTIGPEEQRPAVRFVVAIDTTPFMETLRAFTVGLVALTLIGVVLVALLGYYIARVGLRPLARVADEAQALKPGRLAQRLRADHLPPELTRLTASFNGALDRLESAYQQLEAFNADVAHELRTPLTNMIGQTQVALSRERDGAELKEVLHSNLEEMDRLRAIVNDMLFLARADRGEIVPERVEVSLAQEVDRTVEFLEFVLEEAGMQVRVDGDVQAGIQTSLFQRAVVNLLQNAVEHSPRGAEIVVTLAQQPHGAVISVRNPGAEIAKEHLSRLFDRFYRVDRARSGSGGGSHGLGLSIVKAVAAMHGGSVFAESGRAGTTIGFTVATAG